MARAEEAAAASAGSAAKVMIAARFSTPAPLSASVIHWLAADCVSPARLRERSTTKIVLVACAGLSLYAVYWVLNPVPAQRYRTSFLLVVVVVALLTFFAFDLAVDRGLLVRTASRIVFIPLVAGVSYEILRIGARFGDNPFVKAMFAPNLALQALTTNVPDDSQIEVAIASFQAVVTATNGDAAVPAEVELD